MKISFKQAAVAGVATVAAATGGGIALAAGTGNAAPKTSKSAKSAAPSPAKDRQAFLDDVAKRLGVSSQKLEDAIDAAAKARGGKTGGPFFGPGRGGPGPGPGFGPGGRPFDVIREGAQKAADYLGLSLDKLREQLMDGKSLADVAKAQNKDVAGLKSALLDYAKSKLAEAVKDKRLTQDQADDISKDLSTRIDDLVDGKGPGFGPGFGHGPGGPGFRHP